MRTKGVDHLGELYKWISMHNFKVQNWKLLNYQVKKKGSIYLPEGLRTYQYMQINVEYFCSSIS